MYLAEKRTSDGSYQCWNIENTYKALRAKREPAKTHSCVEHPLLGREFNYNGGIAKITKVVKHWHAGFYLMAIYEINGSHGTVNIENINSIDECIINDLNRFYSDFNLIELPETHFNLGYN